MAKRFSDIEEHVYALLLIIHPQLSLPEGYCRRDELAQSVEEKVHGLLAAFEVPELVDVPNFCSLVIDDFLENDVVVSVNIKFAGDYVLFQDVQYDVYRGKQLQNNDIVKNNQAIGSRYFPDVFQGFIAEREGQAEDIPPLGMAPASNRIVRFSDNQVIELEKQTSDLIDAVEARNRIEGAAGLRELLLGQLRAGRELIRAGTVRAYLLQLTLVETLKFLAARYEKEIIGALAAALLAALLQHLGLSG